MPYPRKTAEVGARFGSLEIISVGRDQRNYTQVTVRCDCGAVKQTRLSLLSCSRPTKCRECAISARRVPIRDKETGQIYRSMSEAAAAFGYSKTFVSLCLKSGTGGLAGRLERLDEPGVVDAVPEPDPPPTEAVVAAFDGRPVMPLRELQSLFGAEVVSECFGFIKLEARGFVRLLRD
jgi:hypothetical protein